MVFAKVGRKPFAVATLLVATCGMVGATTTGFETMPGATVPDGAVKASALFVTFNGFLTLEVKNLLVDQTSVGQNISDIKFVIDGATTEQLSKALLDTKLSTGTDRDIGKGGAFVDTVGVVPGWALAVSTLNSLPALHLYVIPEGSEKKAPSTPAETIIGLPNAISLKYDNANGSIADNGPHNPFLYQPSFYVNAPILTTDSKITQVQFSFGTTAGVYRDGFARIPEPATISLFAMSGALALVGLRRKRQQ